MPVLERVIKVARGARPDLQETDSSRTFDRKQKRPLVAASSKLFDLLSRLVAGAGFEPATFGL
jgi:hypothetical protein